MFPFFAALADTFDSFREIFAVTGLFFLVVIVALWLLLRSRGRKPIYPYALKAVLSPAEALFFEALLDALPEGCHLLSKVRLADFLDVTGEAGEERLGHFARIAQKHTDFLVIDAGTAQPLVAVELDDSSHQTNRRTVENDLFKNAAYHAAGLAILRFPVERSYDRRQLRRALEQGMEDTMALSGQG